MRNASNLVTNCLFVCLFFFKFFKFENLKNVYKPNTIKLIER